MSNEILKIVQDCADQINKEWINSQGPFKSINDFENWIESVPRMSNWIDENDYFSLYDNYLENMKDIWEVLNDNNKKE
jgi:hypothetical protein